MLYEVITDSLSIFGTNCTPVSVERTGIKGLDVNDIYDTFCIVVPDSYNFV